MDVARVALERSDGGNDVKIQGEVTRLFLDRGYVWVKGDNGTDYFAHASQIKGTRINDLWQGRRVEFVPQEGDRGPYAESVEIVEI